MSGNADLSRDEEGHEEIPLPPLASEDPVHDQLPSVEEIRMSASKQSGATSKGLHNSRTPWIVFTIVVLVLVAVIIGLSVGLVKEGEREREPRSDEVREWLLENGISSEDDLERGEWQDAVRWIADQDERYLPIPFARESPEGIDFINRYVVALIYFTMNGRNWKNQLDFLSEKDVCSWFRVFATTGDRVFKIGATCDVPGQVGQLHILGNNLKGTIPPEISHLSKLEFLAMNGNDISGTIPEGLRGLTDLYYLALHYNLLTGELPPWLGELTKLRVVGLGENQLVGAIPQSYSNLIEMVTLGLDHNRITGDIGMLNTMTKMKRLYLEDNIFTGDINDAVLPHLEVLEDLDLSDNAFGGTIPGHFIGHRTLNVLDLGGNDLQKQIPEQFAVMEYPLTYLGLRDNQLTGQIPVTALNSFMNITHVDLSQNLLTGEIPEDLTSLSKLTYLFLSNNNFIEAPIPAFLGDMISLMDLSLKDTKRNGPIPSELGKLTNLLLLDLDDNLLTNSIPEELGQLQRLMFLLLNRNELTGNVPNELGNLQNLEIMLLDRNALTGTVDPICQGAEDIAVFTADCIPNSNQGEVDCECCTRCCQDDATCHTEQYLSALDPSWEHSFARAFYQFSEELILGGQEQVRRGSADIPEN